MRLFAEEILQGGSCLVEGLWGAPKALLAVLAVQATQKSLLLITGGIREDRLFEDISYFDPTLPVEFPAWETLPGEEIAPSPDILGKRFLALDQLLTKKTPSIVLCPLHALLQKIVPKETIRPLLCVWKKGKELSFDQLPQMLTELGYRRSALASDKGEFAVRGGILDLFPVASADPFRIEFFGDAIDQIRTFDPVGQKSIAKISEFFLSPAQELPLLQKAKRLVSINDFMESPIVFWDDILAIENTYVALKEMPGAKSLFFDSLEKVIQKFDTQIFCAETQIEALSEVVKGKERTKHFQKLGFEIFGHFFKSNRFFHPFLKTELPPEEKEIVVVAQNEREIEGFKKQYGIDKTHFEVGHLSSGMRIADLGLAIVAGSDLSKTTPIRRQKWRSTHHTPASEFHALAPGDLVVHFHSGVGKYLGMEKHANHLGADAEFLAIQYAEESKLFVPISQAYLVSRYIGSSDAPPSLSQLGGKRWTAARMHAQTQIVGYAHDLLQMYAQRAVAGGFRYAMDGDLLQQFEESFPYVATEDQLLAIQEIKTDMLSEKVMDRLICGDVGYGKTEVAMRAAFKAVTDGKKQVAVLVPTTVLAMQHFETFSARMEGFPVTLGIVSRFQSVKENRQTIEKVKEGKVDILIGTHRILSEDVQFQDLGLIIIDEEQRFGVRAKEALKKRKVSIDCLTLSATPIPRTLYMSLVHARDMSVINTPPQDRLPIKSIIAETDPELIQNALMRELSRGGQSFYIHNRVESIYERAGFIEKLIPAARVAVVHGQMDADEIDEAFHRFKQGEVDVLCATTIVENGVDIPNANTMLIDRADTFGLADLHQFRGRVGRWNRAAYAYFLIPKNKSLPEIAKKRLNALVEAGSFSGGMKIAMRDLEIRGAGDLLGVQQSGQVSAIGFHLYCKLLKRAMDALRTKKPISFNEAKLEHGFDARLPDMYINEVSIRMEIYHRLGEVTSLADVDTILAELIDRFGEPPAPVIWLMHLTRIRLFASERQISLLVFQNLSLVVEKTLGKTVEKKTLPLPKKVQNDPKTLESYVMDQIRDK